MPVFEVVVCTVSSMFFHVTVVPTLTTWVVPPGWPYPNSEFLMYSVQGLGHVTAGPLEEEGELDEVPVEEEGEAAVAGR